MEPLYDDGVIKIEQTKTPNEHNLYVKDEYCYLSRGILKECAEVDSEGLGLRLRNVNGDFLRRVLEGEEISLQGLGWAFAKARIRELEEEVSYFIHEAREVREELLEYGEEA